jgi:hypothetical protein
LLRARANYFELLGHFGGAVEHCGYPSGLGVVPIEARRLLFFDSLSTHTTPPSWAMVQISAKLRTSDKPFLTKVVALDVTRINDANIREYLGAEMVACTRSLPPSWSARVPLPIFRLLGVWGKILSGKV